MKTGVIEFVLSNVGSKSEKMQPFLKEADGNLIEVYKDGDNPFKNTELKQYEGMTVTVTGEQNEYGVFIIDTINVVEGKALAEETSEPVLVQKSEVEEEPIAKTVADIPEDKSPDEAEETEAPAPKATIEPPLKGFKKFLALFHRK